MYNINTNNDKHQRRPHFSGNLLHTIITRSEHFINYRMYSQPEIIYLYTNLSDNLTFYIFKAFHPDYCE